MAIKLLIEVTYENKHNQKKVILQYIPLIVGALLVSSIISNIVIRIYMQQEVMEDLKNEAAIVNNVFFAELGNDRNIDREKKFLEAMTRTRRLDKVGLESQFELISKLPNGSIQTKSQNSQFDSQMLKQIVSRLEKKEKIDLS